MAKTGEKNQGTNLSTRPFGMKDKLCYSFGDIANDFTFIMISSYMLKFYTDVMGVSAALVGTLMALSRFIDAFTDIGMGTLVDGTDASKSKFGKFRIWMLRGCVPCALFGFLIFAGGWIKGAAMGIKIAWLIVTYILWGSIFYTMVNIPYGSMASAITDNPDQRTQLSSFRSMGAVIASMVLGVVGPLVVYVTNDEGNSVMDSGRMIGFAAVCCIMAIVCYLICIFGSVDRVYMPAKKKEPKKPGEKGTVATLVTDKALLLLIIGTICLLLTQLTQQSMAQYIYPNYYGNTTAQSMASMIGCAAMLLAAALAPKLSSKFGKRELGIFAMFGGAVVYLIGFLIRPSNVWGFVAISTLAYLVMGAFNAVSFAMIIDVIDNAEVKSGKRNDGKYYGVYSFARKLGQAASSLISGALLTMIGYTEATAYTESVLNGIFNITTLVPAIGFTIAGIFLVLYPMKKSVVDANAKELKARRGK